MKKTILFALTMLTLSSYAQWVIQASGFATASRGIQDICVVDANVVWAAAYDGAVSTNACSDFTKTVNGGTTWTAGTVTGATGTSIANICAINATQAWTIHYYPSGTGTLDGIYYTSNGGTSWVHQTTAAFSNASSFPDCMWFWDANNGYCVGDPINGDFEIYTTSNGGTTWTQVPGANIPNPLSGEWGVVGYQSIIGNTVWFGTNLGRVYKSVDKGLNWTVATCTPLNNKYIQPFFKNPTFGLVMDKDASTTGTLAMSSDGGATFTARNNTGHTFTNDMAYIPGSASTWVTTGADATNNAAGVTYSFDDGATFNDMPLTIGDQYLATGWLNDSTGWAGGFNTDATTGGMFKFNGHLVPADFTANTTTIGAGGQVTFTCTVGTSATATFLWTFSGGNPATSTLKHPPAVTYNSPGDYTVSLQITSDWGVSTATKTNYIHVNANTLSVVPPNQDVTAPAGSTSFTVTSNASWTVVSDQTWCTVTPSGTGNGTITANYTENTTAGQRIANITVSATGAYPVVVTVTQAGIPPFLTVDPPNQNVSAAAGWTSFTVTSNADWSVVSDQTWCTVTPGGFGNGTIVADVTENTEMTSRVANITVTVIGLTPVVVTVTQDAALPALAVAPPNQNVTYTAGSTSFTVTSNS